MSGIVMPMIGMVKFQDKTPQGAFLRLTRVISRFHIGKAVNIRELNWSMHWRELDLRDHQKLTDKCIDMKKCGLEKLVLPYHSKVTYNSIRAMPRCLHTLKLKGLSDFRSLNFPDVEITRILNNHYYLY
jgi:hypothetical protein